MPKSSDKTSAAAPTPPRTIASVAPGARRTIASYANYADAESAVEWLADQGFAVERGAIVGRGLRSVEQVEGRMTGRRAALVGSAGGFMMAALFALLAGIFGWDSGSAEMLAYVVVLGALSGALVHEVLSAGRRDFISSTRLEADRYDVQIDELAADDATRLLAAMPA